MRAGTGSSTLAQQFRRFGAGARHDGATRYARICQGAATDGALLELAAEAPPDQRRPNILLAAVHFLLLSGVDDPLADFYPTVLAWRDVDPAGPARPVAADPFPPFAAFCARHRESIAQLVATRATQTNEVGRCTAIFPALSTVASRAEAPLAVVDLGAAAGLNLLFDRFAYVYTYDFGPGYADDAGDRSRVVGDAGSPVLLHCQEVPGLPVPPPEGGRVLAATAVVLVELAPGSQLVAHRLADMHSHGRWLYWYGPDG